LGFQSRASFRRVNALSLDPDEQQIHFGKFSFVEPRLVIGDDLAEVVVVFSIELGVMLGGQGCPVSLAHSESDLKTHLLGLEPAALKLLRCGGNSTSASS
jgi:hypothetical protein